MASKKESISLKEFLLVEAREKCFEIEVQTLKEFEQHRRETSAALEEMQRRARERDSRRWWGWAAAVS